MFFNCVSDNRKEVQRRAILEFERRFVGNETEETFEQRDIAGKEMRLRDLQLMALLLDPRAKASTSLLSRERWVRARLFLRTECVRICATIKLLERKGLVSRKRDATEVDLDADILLEPNSESMNDVRTLADISMFDFGVEVEATIDDTDSDMDNEEFLNGTHLKRGVEFDNAINLWTRYMPD